VDLSNPQAAKLEDGPKLGVKNGMADASVGVTAPFVTMVGGESQKNGEDTELHLARWLDTRTLTVWSLPPAPSRTTTRSASCATTCSISLVATAWSYPPAHPDRLANGRGDQTPADALTLRPAIAAQPS